MLVPFTKRKEHHSQIFNFKQEEHLAQYLKEFCLYNHGLSIQETKKLALSFAQANNVNVPQNWLEKEEASKDWLTCFF